MSSVRFRVFTRQGILLSELIGDVERSWTLDEAGRFSAKIPRNSREVTERNLRFGNLVLIESDVVQAWGGFIWTPRQWADDVISIEGQGAEALLKQRVVLSNKDPDTRTVTGWLTGLINDANQQSDTRIHLDPSNIEDKGEMIYKFQGAGLTVYEALEQLRAITGSNWWLKPVVDSSNNLYFEMFWAKRRASLGHQIVMSYSAIPAQDTFLTEDGEIVTAVLVIPNSVDKTGQYFRNQNAINYWGLRESTYVSEFDIYDASFYVQARNYLAKESRVKRYFSVDVPVGIPTIGSLGPSLEPGSIHWFYAGNYGFTKNSIEAKVKVRVKGMAYAEAEGKISLVIQSITDDEEYIDYD